MLVVLMNQLISHLGDAVPLIIDILKIIKVTILLGAPYIPTNLGLTMAISIKVASTSYDFHASDPQIIIVELYPNLLQLENYRGPHIPA